jgi:hypothetical protein
VINGHLTKVTYIDSSQKELSDGSLKELLYSLAVLYSPIANITNIANKPNIAKSLDISENQDFLKNEKVDVIRFGEGFVEFEYSADDKEYMREAQQRRAEEKALNQKARDEERMAKFREKVTIRDRNLVPPSDWSVSDIAYYFQEMAARWDLMPWRVKETRFLEALGNAHSKHGTDGAQEKAMVDAFLAQPWVKTVKDPNRLWKSFIQNFSALKEQVSYYVYDTEVYEEQAEDSLARAKRMLGE